MTAEEAIKRIQDHMDVHRIGDYPHIKLREALNMAISALREQEERRWISVNDRLPKEDGFYRVYHKNSKAICDRFYYKDCPDLFVNVMDDPITHWKPIEHPPKGE